MFRRHLLNKFSFRVIFALLFPDEFVGDQDTHTHTHSKKGNKSQAVPPRGVFSIF